MCVATLMMAALFARPRSMALHRAALILAGTLILRYVAWRAGYTLAWDRTAEAVASFTLLGADLYSAASLLIFHLHLWNAKAPEPRAKAGERRRAFAPSVDMFITIYDEPIEILYRTAVGCLAQDYSNKKVFILDDGDRDEVRRLAGALGCGYISRREREGAKAGNVNNALRRTNGELVALFDVDHIPVSSFLSEVIGFFEDDKVAVVQTPHHFANQDPLRRNISVGRQPANEQDLFYKIIINSLSLWNGAFFAGSAGVLRRRALEEVGGFRTETLTEDTDTSLQLLSRGYRILYHNRDLIHGLVPESLDGYVIQRARWAVGNLQIAIRDCPLFKKGLTLAQRALYTNLLTYFLFPFPRLVYLLTPVICLIFGLKPMEAGVVELADYFLPMFLMNIVVFDAICGHISSFALSAVHEILLTVPLLGKFLKTFVLRTPSSRSFSVTPKGEISHVPRYHWGLAWPIALILAATLVAVGFGSLRYGEEPALRDMIVLNIAWCAYNALFCAIALGCARNQPYRRASPRIPLRLEAAVRSGERLVPVETIDVSEQGCQIRVESAAPLPERFELDFRGAGKDCFVRGEYVQLHRGYSGFQLVQVKFVDVDERQRRSIVELAYTMPESVAERRPTRGVTTKEESCLSNVS
ncbi:MAG: glycosyltransferase [Elusimicrobia bacterium]|nr:glycosyltransferase [Elusimicrobiota bacterium]